MIDKIAAKFGRKVWETPIGFKYICDRMLEGDILLGGEESGGIGTKLYLPERDATVNALLLAEVMAWHGKRLGELVADAAREFGEHHYGRVDLDAARRAKGKGARIFRRREVKQLLDWPVVRREDLGRHESLPGRHRLGDGACVGHRTHAARLFGNHPPGNHAPHPR